MSKQETRQKLFEEFDYKDKAGTAWSHNYLNQKPWHPLSYPNQRRKWIAEQMHGMGEKHKSEVEKEFQKEQDFLKSSAMLSKKQRQKVEALQSVSFMYTKPPGYNAESARAAEMADEQRKAQEQEGQLVAVQPGGGEVAGGEAEAGEAGEAGEGEISEAMVLAKSGPMGGGSSADGVGEQPKKKRVVPRDVFGSKIATEEDFAILKDAPRVETGLIGRAKPLGIELRNVRCGRCSAVGHQSGDRECPMRDVVSEADLKRQQREDPLSLILAQNRNPDLPWEPKQALGGFSPVRGGYKADDPNQQILLPDEEEEMLIDPHGGFLLGADTVDPGLEGVSQMVLEALTKRQKKELKSALKAKKEEERRRKKEKKKRRKEEEKKKHKRKGKGDDDDDSDTTESSEESEEDEKKHQVKGKGDQGKHKSGKGEGSKDASESSEDERRRKGEHFHKKSSQSSSKRRRAENSDDSASPASSDELPKKPRRQTGKGVAAAPKSSLHSSDSEADGKRSRRGEELEGRRRGKESPEEGTVLREIREDGEGDKREGGSLERRENEGRQQEREEGRNAPQQGRGERSSRLGKGEVDRRNVGADKSRERSHKDNREEREVRRHRDRRMDGRHGARPEGERQRR